MAGSPLPIWQAEFEGAGLPRAFKLSEGGKVLTAERNGAYWSGVTLLGSGASHGRYEANFTYLGHHHKGCFMVGLAEKTMDPPYEHNSVSVWCIGSYRGGGFGTYSCGKEADSANPILKQPVKDDRYTLLVDLEAGTGDVIVGGQIYRAWSDLKGHTVVPAVFMRNEGDSIRVDSVRHISTLAEAIGDITRGMTDIYVDAGIDNDSVACLARAVEGSVTIARLTVRARMSSAAEAVLACACLRVPSLSCVCLPGAHTAACR